MLKLFLVYKEVNNMTFKNTLAYAQELDNKDHLAKFRTQFHHPVINGKQVLYFTGNSLGLQPTSAKDYVNLEMDDWKKWGVEGHFHGTNPWVSYHELLTPISAEFGWCQSF